MSDIVVNERRRQALYGWIMLSPAAILLTTLHFIHRLQLFGRASSVEKRDVDRANLKVLVIIPIYLPILHF
jgi:hypothetical protein